MSAIKNVLGYYPGFDVSSKLWQPFMPLFHYFDELNQPLLKNDKEIEESNHLKLLIETIGFIERDSLNAKTQCLEKRGVFTSNTCWVVFRPGTVIVERRHRDKKHLPQAYVVSSVKFDKHRSRLGIEAWYMEYNSGVYGRCKSETWAICEFSGGRSIRSFGIYPLEFDENPVELRNQLIERGRKFISVYKSTMEALSELRRVNIGLAGA